MKTSALRSVAAFCAGAVMMAAVMTILPRQQAQAPVANGNDKFSMITVPLQETGVPEGVFVLNNLTGMLVGSALNESTSRFSISYMHNVAADFQTGNTPDRRDLQHGGQGDQRADGALAERLAHIADARPVAPFGELFELVHHLRRLPHDPSSCVPRQGTSDPRLRFPMGP